MCSSDLFGQFNELFTTPRRIFSKSFRHVSLSTPLNTLVESIFTPSDALCDKLESKKVDEVVRNLVSSGWNIREVAWEASSFDHEMPYFDTGRDFDIGFPDTLSSKIEFLTANGSIVQARARLHFKQALIFAKASKHVAALKNSLDYYYGSSVIPPQNHGGYL